MNSRSLADSSFLFLPAFHDNYFHYTISFEFWCLDHKKQNIDSNPTKDSHSLVDDNFYSHEGYHDNYFLDKFLSELGYLDHKKLSIYSNRTNDLHSRVDDTFDFQLQCFVRYIQNRSSFVFEIRRRCHMMLSTETSLTNWFALLK